MIDIDPEDGESQNETTCADLFLQAESEEEKKDMEALIGDNWLEVIMKARRGELLALRAIAVFLDSMPRDERPALCEVLCFHLRKPVPANTNPQDINSVEQIAIVATSILYRVLSPSFASEMEETVKASWRAIARWLHHFNKKFLEKNSRGSLSLALSMANLLGRATILDSIKELVCTDRKTLMLITRLWSKEQTLSFSADRDGYASEALVQCGIYRREVRDLLENMLIHQCFHADVVAVKFHERIYQAFRWLPDAWRSLEYYSEALLLFTTQPPELAGPIQLTFNINEGAYDLNDMLCRVLQGSFPSPDDSHYAIACRTMSNFLTFFIYTFELTYGEALVGNLLVGSFLKALIDFSPHITRKSVTPYFRRLAASAIVKTLPRFVLVYSLLGRFEKGFRVGYTDEARKKLCESPVREEWTLLANFLEEKAAYKVFFDRNEDKQPKSLLCGNPDCKNVDKVDDFKLCAACKLERYCSKECQVIAWKEKGHKQTCKKPAPNRGTEKDEDFINYCIRRDVIRHLPGLRECAQERLPGIPFNELGVGINYTKLHMTFEIFRLRSLIDQVYDFDKTLQSRLERLTEMAKDGVDEFLFVRAVIPNGKGQTKTIHIELSLKTADAFAVSHEGSSGRDAPQRPVGYYNGHKPLKVVAFDKVDQYLAGLADPEKMDVDEE